MSSSPYSNVPSSGFWRSGVTEQNPLQITDIYKRKFRITKSESIATAGSCFAQHIANHLRHRKFNIMQYEPAPRGMKDTLAKKYGFGIYTCRYGNIYTAAQMLQLAREAFNHATPSDQVWEKDGRYYDAQRITVEPRGFESPEIVLLARKKHLAHVRKMLLEMDVFIFTFGLTESWRHTETGTIFPTAPGTVAGSYNPNTYHFHNFTHSETLKDFIRFKRLLKRERNKKLKYIVTVSPVPLTATASGQHVLSASTYSKSILRAVTGELMQTHRDVDYFPSYELITSSITRGIYFEPNQRDVTQAGVNAAMSAFLTQHDPTWESTQIKSDALNPATESENDLVCEDVLLEAFQK